MEKREQNTIDNVKIAYQNLTIIQRLKSTSYQSFKAQIFQHFRLSQKAYYQLFYRTKFNDQISIISAQNFSTFLQLNSKIPTKLYLNKTEKKQLHFEGKASQVYDRQQKNQELQRLVQDLREESRIYLKLQKQKLKQKILKQLQQQKLLAYSLKQKQIHTGIECNKCKTINIRGIRYKCAICQYNLCQRCEGAGYEHPDNHPLIKIKTQKQGLFQKSDLFASDAKKNKGKVQINIKNQSSLLIQGLREFACISKEKAQSFIRKHPKMSLNQLIQEYLIEQSK